MYVADCSKKLVVVMDSDGHYERAITNKTLSLPTGVHIVGQYVYVSDYDSNRVAVFETSTGQFVTSFGRKGHGKGEFSGPYCITSCDNKGFIYVCDSGNDQVQVF